MSVLKLGGIECCADVALKQHFIHLQVLYVCFFFLMDESLVVVEKSWEKQIVWNMEFKPKNYPDFFFLIGG